VKPAGSYFDRVDLAAVIALTAVAFVLRFFSPILPDFFLHPFQGPWITNCVSPTPVDPQGDLGTICGLAYPFNKGSQVNGQYEPPHGEVFDEVYFPKDAWLDIKGIEHCRRTTVNCIYNYFDPEPPLAKEMIAAGELGYGWFRATFQGAHGEYVDLGNNTFGWRIAACLFGTLCIPMFYLLARRLWSNRLFAIAAGTLVCFDGMFFIQSRIGMIDIFPIFLILASYFMFLVHIQSQSLKASLLTLFALGTVLGIGIAAKWIVLAAWTSIVFWLVARIVLRSLNFDFGPRGFPFLSWRRDQATVIPGTFWPAYLAVALIALLIIPLAIYLLSWYPFFARGQFQGLADLIKYQQDSFTYHHNLTATHPYGSKPWSWPFLMRPVLYYAEYQDLGADVFTGQPLIARISNLGNPWIWWTSLPCLVALPYYVIRHRSFAAAVILLGFISQYFPWFLISRVLFMYHIFGGLIFMTLAAAFVVAQLAQNLRPPGRNWLVAAYLAMAALFFGYFYPEWTALPISQSAYYAMPGTPLWGPKLWLVNCHGDPALQPQIFCWN
jgi:C-terminal four TMM region of protein-O-mannosyltransferase/Dolichyl-phosphate-mannose-protein mannosyltransferase